MMSLNLRGTTTLTVMIALAALVALSAAPARAGGREADRHDRDRDEHERHEYHGHSVTPITTCPYVITAPGYYELEGVVIPAGNTHTLTCGTSVTAPAVTITVSHVHLSLNTTKLTTNNKTNPGPGVYVHGASRLTGVEIEGPGSIVGFGVGIEVDNVDDSEVERVTVATSITHGIQTSSVTGLELEGNVLTRNGGFGLNLVSSSRGRVKGNVVTANGIFKPGSPAPVATALTLALTLNTAPNQIGIGIGIFGGSGNRVDRNSVTANFGLGIAVDGNSTGNEFHDNEAAGNLTLGQGSNSGKFTNLFFGTGSTGNEVGHNEALSVEDDNVCGVNLFYNNTIITSFISNGTSPGPGTYLSPLSLTAGYVISPAPSLCIQ